MIILNIFSYSVFLSEEILRFVHRYSDSVGIE